LIITIREGCSGRNASSVRQSQGQKEWPDTRGNGSDDSTNVDKYPEGLGQKEAMKYLKGKLLPLH